MATLEEFRAGIGKGGEGRLPALDGAGGGVGIRKAGEKKRVLDTRIVSDETKRRVISEYDISRIVLKFLP